MISIKFGRKNLNWKKKSYEYHTNHQKISHKHIKNIFILIKIHKQYLETYENKHNFSKTWTLPYIYSRKHKILLIPIDTIGNYKKNII